MSSAATSRHKKPPKRKKIDVDPPPSAKRQKRGSSCHVPTTDTSSSPITVATTRKTASSKSKIDILQPPVWSSDEEEELSNDNDSTQDDDLDKQQDSSQLTKKEKKAIALKRLKKARKHKGEKLPYFSPVGKSKLNGYSTKKASSSLTRYDSDEFDELATQIPGSMSDAVAPMPWESDEEDITIVKEKEEPVYEEKISAKVIDDLPPPLPQPEKVWKRKVRPPSRKDLFDATQRPSTRHVSPVRSREDSDELPDLMPRTSSNTKHEESTPAKGTVSCKADPSSATLNEAQSSRNLTRSLSIELSPALQRSASAKVQLAVKQESAAMPAQGPTLKEGTRQEDALPPVTVPEELPYWEDNSFMEGDFSIGDEDVNMASLRPFFTPSPPHNPPAPVAGPSTIELDKLIAKAAEPTQLSQTQLRKSASPTAAKHTPIARQSSPALIPKVSSSTKRASRAVVDANRSPSARGSIDRPLLRADKGKGRAIDEEAGIPVDADEHPRSSLKQVQALSEEEWSDFDELELTQGTTKRAGLDKLHLSPMANSPTRDDVATSVQRSARKTSPVKAGVLKLPSSEEESQACSFCGNIYPIGALPTHVEACQAAQIYAAASQAGKAGSTSRGTFRYSEEPKPKPRPGLLNNSTALTSQSKAAFESEPHKVRTQQDDLEALLFGKPSVKARQIHDSPARRDKGKGRATDDSGDDLTSPDVPLRQMRPTTTRGQSSAKRQYVEDVIELHDDEHTSKPNGHSWRTEPPTKQRIKPVRAPDPQPGPAAEVDYDEQDIGSSPPTGSIFISKLPRSVQQGYFRLTGLDTHGEIATMSMKQLIQKPRALPTRGPPFRRGRGRGAPSRGGKGRSKKK